MQLLQAKENAGLWLPKSLLYREELSASCKNEIEAQNRRLLRQRLKFTLVGNLPENQTSSQALTSPFKFS
jgi:hypothetical protein